jgi:hypothetical protein
MRRFLIPIAALTILIGGCAMYQSIIKSSFPYTSSLTIVSSAQAGNEYSAVNIANSFDQNFSKSGNNADRITLVRVVSAKLRSDEPTDYNIGNLSSVKIFLSKEDGKDEMLVAKRTDISANAGNGITLDIDNSKFLDQLVREPNIKIHMVYKVRKPVKRDVSLHLILDLSAYPNPKD